MHLMDKSTSENKWHRKKFSKNGQGKNEEQFSANILNFKVTLL